MKKEELYNQICDALEMFLPQYACLACGGTNIDWDDTPRGINVYCLDCEDGGEAINDYPQYILAVIRLLI